MAELGLSAFRAALGGPLGNVALPGVIACRFLRRDFFRELVELFSQLARTLSFVGQILLDRVVGLPGGGHNGPFGWIVAGD